MHTLRLHDTLSRSLQPVTASDGKALRFYCCGPTVYGPAHIGNFRTFLAQDLFRRVVELTGLKTKHVRNITDVDDKTIRQSQAEGQTLDSFTSGWREKFDADCIALNLLKPHLEPGAVDHIPEQITLIEQLIEKGNAYASEDGSVYFNVGSYPAYGKLSRLDQRELKTGASETANDSDEYDKESASDFVLWKARKPEDGDNFWPSPWGEGRPGWHLECSAMGHKYLGEDFDLHSGGVDLCFPHHENEIAQSEAATGNRFSRLWFHIEHLMVDSAKMSKSLGNLYTLGDLQEKGYTSTELRYALLKGHYRQKLNFSLDQLRDARLNLQRLSDLQHRLEKAAATTPPAWKQLTKSAAKSPLDAGPFQEAFESLLHDLNAPAALGKIFGAAKPLEKGDLTKEEATSALHGLGILMQAFGFELPAPTEESVPEAPEEVKVLAEKRWAARAAKDWAASDTLRDELAALGWAAKDGKESYTLQKI